MFLSHAERHLLAKLVHSGGWKEQRLIFTGTHRLEVGCITPHQCVQSVRGGREDKEVDEEGGGREREGERGDERREGGRGRDRGNEEREGEGEGVKEGREKGSGEREEGRGDEVKKKKKIADPFSNLSYLRLNLFTQPSDFSLTSENTMERLLNCTKVKGQVKIGLRGSGNLP